MPHKADIQIGPLTLSLLVTAIVSPSGEYLGNALEWADVTEKRKMGQQSAAIAKCQAIIEFNLDGSVVTANDNFLNCLGYTLDEIKGQHHRMFCDPAYVNSSEYPAFWAKLNRGEFDAGVYRRIGKGGKEIWIQAVYNPILNAWGKPHKVVKLGSDIMEQKNKAAEFEGKLAAVSKAQAIRIQPGEKSMDDFAIAIDKIPKIVFSQHLKNTEWDSAQLSNRSLEEEVLELKQSRPASGGGGKDIFVGSRSLIIQLMNLNLIDEYQLCVHPVVAGSGLPLFENIKDRFILKLIKTKTFRGGAITLYYEPAKQ